MTRLPLACLAVFFLPIASCVVSAQSGASIQKSEPKQDIRQQQAKSGNGGWVAATPPDLRREVLRLAAKHDRDLGEELLKKLKDDMDRESSDSKEKRPSPFGNSDAAVHQRLDLARQLLAAGDTERAMQFAESALGIVGQPAIDFLSYLREKNPIAADERYAALLANAARDSESDANTVSLLSSYIFTPHAFISFVSGGTDIPGSETRRLLSLPNCVLPSFARRPAFC